ncbi:hypothetical protein [Magnetovibrio sp.]|uniref:hypothetical protein n=1 Tax=Magnetovibrio sp. TaxID=2024836 RepID=UPI002F95A24B
MAFVGGLPAAPLEAAGRVSRTLALEDVSRKKQIAYAYGHAALNLTPGLITKINAAAFKAYMKVKKSNLLDPVYDNAIVLGEAVSEGLSGLGMDWALGQRGNKKDQGKPKK